MDLLHTNIILNLNKYGYDLIQSSHDTIMKLNITKLQNRNKFTGKIDNYYISNYPDGYDPLNLPHDNNLEAAKTYCKKYQLTGITYQYGRYEVRKGAYLEYHNDHSLFSWIYV